MPCYKRPEYTKLCIKALEEAQAYPRTAFYLVDDGSEDGTREILEKSTLPKRVTINKENKGLRDTVIDFFETVRDKDYDFIAIVGNDVLMPKDWVKKMIDKFEVTDADVLSPNYMPSNPAYAFGQTDDKGLGYRPEKMIVGLWFMKIEMIKDLIFERFHLWGIKGSKQLLTQIKLDKDPKIGWNTDVMAQDLGHWSGKHPDHIKTMEHLEYYNEVGRNLSYA